MFSLASQGLGLSAIPENYVSAVHLLRNGKLGSENAVCEVRRETAPGHEAGSLSGRAASDDDIQIALERKTGFIKQRHIGKKVCRSPGSAGLLL